MIAARRWIVLGAGVALACSGALPLARRLVYADAPAAIPLDASHVSSRSVEDVTVQATAKLYARAWQDLSSALSNNDSSRLAGSFVGFARDRFTQQIADQQRAGFTTKLTPISHHATIEFYSIDGANLQIRDEVQLQREIVDGGKTIASETKTVPFVAVLSVVDDGWRLRILDQAQE